MKAIDLYVAALIQAIGAPERWDAPAGFLKGKERSEAGYQRYVAEFASSLVFDVCREHGHDVEAQFDLSEEPSPPLVWWRCERCGRYFDESNERDEKDLLDSNSLEGREPLASRLARAKAALSKP